MKRNIVGVKALEERISKLRKELAGIVDDCAAVEAARDSSLAGHDGLIAAAKCRTETLLSKKASQLKEAKRLLDEGEELITKGEALCDRAREMEQAAVYMDLGRADIRLAEQARRDCEEHWKAELARVQDGVIRRQRNQLAAAISKLERRLAGKAADEPGPSAKVVEPSTSAPPKPSIVSLRELITRPPTGRKETLAALAVAGRLSKPKKGKGKGKEK